MMTKTVIPLAMVVIVCSVLAEPSDTTSTSSSQRSTRDQLQFRRFGIGMEVELTERFLEHLVRYIDWPSVQSGYPAFMRHIFASDLDRYLESPGSLQSLPRSVQEELTRGLRLEPPSLLGPDGNAFTQTLQTQPTRIVPSQRRILGPDGNDLPAESPNTLQRSQLEIPNTPNLAALSPTQAYQRDLGILHSRWRNHIRTLTESQLAQFIQLVHLPRDIKANILRVLVSISQLRHLVSLRPDLTDSQRAIFENLPFGFDALGVVEFRHTRPYHTIAGYEQSRARLFRAAGIPDLFDTRNDFMGASYHLNISVPGQNLQALSQPLDDLLRVRLAVLGLNSHSSSGVVRYHSLEDRMEFRAHVLSPITEVQEYLNLLRLPTELAQQRIREKTAEAFTYVM